MGDMVRVPSSNMKFSNKTLTKSNKATSSKNPTFTKTLKHLKDLRLEEGPSCQIILFLVEVVVLDIVRRFSKRKCPFVWHGLQALQVLIYPPFKWIQRWAPLRNLIKGIQIFSRPLMFLSVATTFLEHSQSSPKITDDMDYSQTLESAITQTTSEMIISDETVESSEPDNWLLQLRKDLENHGVTLPERITDDELHRFHTAADGDFPCMLKSIKRTIRWRETYNILSLEELEMWSHLVFWHGIDVELRPCLVIRFGLACSIVVPHDRPCFSQAIVSQMEHGVLHLVKEDDPRITVLMDCEGLSTLRFPVQMMRSCSAVMQDHYPNRLANLFVVRLPPISRVLMQTLFQIMEPKTRAKLRIEGEKTYKEVLSNFLQSVPAFLGGKCTCATCCTLLSTNTRRQLEEVSRSGPCSNFSGDEFDGSAYQTADVPYNGNYEQVLRTAVLVVLMLWIFVAFLIGMHDSENLAS